MERVTAAVPVAARAFTRRMLRRGPRTVLLTPSPGPRFGNFLYYWLHADIRRGSGQDFRVLRRAVVEPWLVELPAVVEQLDVASVRPWDRREWPPERQFQRFGTDFGRNDVDSFVRRFLLGSPLLAARPPLREDDVVVNVRRGDYYSVPQFRRAYDHDVLTYVVEAVRRIRTRAPVGRILIVSDGAEWCSAHLAPVLRETVPNVNVVRGTPQEHFRTVATAGRLVGANSTFSYWAGHVATVLHGPTAHVVMPRFHSRLIDEGRAFQLDDRWDVVEDLPGGWAAP